MGASMSCFSAVGDLRRLRAEEEAEEKERIALSNMANPRELDVSHFDLANSLLIGTGGFSTVRAVAKYNLSHDGQGEHNAVYAIKVISKRRVMQRANGPQTAYRELNLLKRIMEHPNSRSPGRSAIINLHFAFTDASSLYLVLDLAWGDLRYHLGKQASSRFAEAQVRLYTAQIVQALAWCHNAVNILHRDIKVIHIHLQK